MKNEPVVTLKTDANCTWIAVLDPASGKRGRYTVYRLYRWADKRADIVGREIDLRAARKLAGKHTRGEAPEDRAGFNHTCDWRKAAFMLAQCVAATLHTDGKIGMGTGMVLRTVNGKKTIERWDRDFIAALAFIGIEVADKPVKRPRKRK